MSPRTILCLIEFLSHQRARGDLPRHDQTPTQSGIAHANSTTHTSELMFTAIPLPVDEPERLVAKPTTRATAYGATNQSADDAAHGGTGRCPYTWDWYE